MKNAQLRTIKKRVSKPTSRGIQEGWSCVFSERNCGYAASSTRSCADSSLLQQTFCLADQTKLLSLIRQGQGGVPHCCQGLRIHCRSECAICSFANPRLALPPPRKL
eukprot:TRINITY_DN30993_c0_g1_i1.p1 TRINITY_DN30993_c0_g1~~TRINITY_DN30993_c0_g1_i1.p1  ORF type:complete len:107 (-),score=9.92 TRINITY_DN30993_c0_g1_i1:558-878(-)